jgi:hypothetical protein
MASIKDLKKDINFLTEEVIGTCLLHYHIQNPDEEKKKEIDQIVDDMIDLRDEVFNKINKPGQAPEGKSKKAWYNELYEQVLEKVNESFDKLNKVSA